MCWTAMLCTDDCGGHTNSSASDRVCFMFIVIVISWSENEAAASVGQLVCSKITLILAFGENILIIGII